MKEKLKNTIATTMRFDVRDMATILQFFQGRGVIHKSLAAVLREVITTFVSILEKHDPDCSVKTFEEALKVLNQTGFGTSNVLAGNLADELRTEQVEAVLAEQDEEDDLGTELRKALERKNHD